MPEYVSTACISVLVSLAFLPTQLARIPGGRGNIQLAWGWSLYLVGLLWLLWRSYAVRRRYSPLMLEADPHEGLILQQERWRAAWDDVTHAELEVVSFYGRSTRCVRLEDRRGAVLHIPEILIDFDEFCEVMRELGHPPRAASDATLAETVPARSEWNERHALFPPPSDLAERLSRVVWRGICLFPVAVFDVVLNLVLAWMLRQIGRPVLMAYAAPLSLMASAIVARYVYYYMFTSAAMNRPLSQL